MKRLICGMVSRALFLLGFVGIGSGLLLMLHDQTLIRKQPEQLYCFLLIGGVSLTVLGSVVLDDND
jgi:hypothetical protein